MKITFSNLGTIKKTELDLRPLTVIIGPNNTSKTYVAYSIYGLWQALVEPPTLWFLDRIGERYGKRRTAWIDIDDKFIARFYTTLTAHQNLFTGQLDSYFQDSSHKLFAKVAFDVNVAPEELRAAVAHAASQKLAPRVLSSLRGTRVSVSFPREQSDQDLVGYFLRFLRIIAEHLSPPPLLLPAERNAFVITYKALATRRFRLLRGVQRELFGKRKVNPREIEIMREQGDIRYPKPVEDFLDFLTDIELSENIELDPQKKNPFQTLADDIEIKIQNKNKTKLIPTKLGGREIKVHVKRGLSIDLYNASSSIKQLAPLLLYLRYRAKPNSLLIIDEPEMNLHPESQAKLLEVLGILVNLGVKVLLTTHSHYFMAHLNNLVIGDANNPEVRKRQAASLYLGDERAFLQMAQVSAYEMKDGKLCSLKDKDYGIRWDTLSDVSGELQQKFFKISEEKEHRGDPWTQAGKGKKGRAHDRSAAIPPES